MWAMLEKQILDQFRTNPNVNRLLRQTESDVRAGSTTPVLAVKTLLAAYGRVKRR
jgi:hypothetical protein